jgi:uncharacterized protein YbjT (DUF2867 family)
MIVITGPTGQIGGRLLANLLGGEEPIRVIARDPGKLRADVRARVEIVQGSYAEREVVMQAFDGADAVFWLPIADPAAASAEAAFVDMSRPAAEALRRHGVRHVVSVSALGRGWPADAGHATASIHMDDMLGKTGANLRALACPSLMDNMLRQAASIADHGVFYGLAPGDFQSPQVAARDVADAASALLRDRSWRGVGTLPLLGPEDVSCNDQARIMAEVLEKPVAYREMAMSDMKAMMLARGASAGMAQAMIDMAAAKNAGLDSMVPRTPENTTPTSFRAWCRTVLKPAVGR